MSKEIPIADPPLSTEEQLAASRLSDADLDVIDAAVLAGSSDRWRKVAWVVVLTKDALVDRYPDLSHTFFAQRVSRLVDEGHLESHGNLSYMRFSEVRLSRKSTNASASSNRS